VANESKEELKSKNNIKNLKKFTIKGYSPVNIKTTFCSRKEFVKVFLNIGGPYFKL